MTYTNLDYLNDFTDGDPDLIKEAIQRYLKSSPNLLHKLNDSYQREDWEQVSFVAHSLYSSTQIVGIHVIAAKLKEIQEMAKDGKHKQEIADYLREINTAIEASYNELNSYN